MSAAATEARQPFVLLGFPDVNCLLRGKALHPDAFATALAEGCPMTDLLLALDPTDEPISDYGEIGIRSGSPDLLARPEPETLRELSWRPGWQLCLATLEWDGRPCELTPRQVLRGALAQLAELGLETLAAVEYEVRLRDAAGVPVTTGSSYNLAGVEACAPFVERLAVALEGMDIGLGAVHTEAGPGLLELNLSARPALRAADDATMARYAVERIAESLGLRASFLAKTAPGEEGSSGHLHLSLWRDGENAFALDGGGELPVALLAAIAGILEHLPAASLLMNPTVNSYKRLVPGWFAPVNVSWATQNRSVAVRAIPAEDPSRCRLECRRPGADASPYLALAALVAAAADGIRRDLRPPAPLEGDAYGSEATPSLPGSLEAALGAFEADHGLRQALGEGFSDYYAVSRRWELAAWQRVVSDWERQRYDRTA